MIVWLLLLLAGAACASEWSASWPPGETATPKQLYTNAYARELEAAILWRSCVIGETNWASGYRTTNRLIHAHCEAWTEQVEDLLPSFLSTNYSRDPDWSFDYWFANAEPSSYRGDFPPSMTKADEFYHHGIGTVLDENHIHLLGSQFTVTNGTAYFTKRKGRLNPLIVGQWIYNPAVNSGWWEFGYTEQSRQAFNEFSDNNDGTYDTGPSTMPHFTTNQHPVFVWTPGGTNAFTPITFHPTYLFEFTALALSNGSDRLWRWEDCVNPPDQILSAATTRADYAWVRFAENYAAGFTNAPANTNDRVTLYWDQPVTTYQGTVTWDWILLPEQLNEHQRVISNMFLTPWTDIYWTNSVLYTNEYIYVAPVDGWPTTNSGDTNYFGYYTNICGSTNAEYSPTPESLGLDWFKDEGCPWIDDLNWPAVVSPVGEGVNTNSQAPFFNYTLHALSSVEQHFEAEANYCPSPLHDLSEHPAVDWEWCAWLDGEGYVSVRGESVVSSLAIAGLWTGTQHRAHIYARYPLESGMYYTRKEITPSTGWSYDPILYSLPFNMWSNMQAGVLEHGECVINSSSEIVWGGIVESDTAFTNWNVQEYTDICITNGAITNRTSLYMYDSSYDCSGTGWVYEVYDHTDTVTAVWAHEPTIINVSVELRGWIDQSCGFNDPCTDWSGEFEETVEYGETHVNPDVAAQAQARHAVTNTVSGGECEHEELSYLTVTIASNECTDTIYGYSITGAGDAPESSTMIDASNRVDVWRIPPCGGLITGRTHEENANQLAAETNFSKSVGCEVKVLIEWNP